MNNKVVIVGASRSAIGKFGGSFKDVGPASLGSAVLADLLRRTGVEGREVDEVIMGNVLSAGHGQNVARQAAIGAGIPEAIPSYCVNKVCGSGLKAVALGTQAIMLGDAHIVVAGGVESMSQAPYALKKARWGARMGNDEAIDLMIHDGLWDIFGDYHMGQTAENVAERFGVSREDQDEFAAESQRRAEAAIKGGTFREEIVPIEVPQRRGDPVMMETDEFPRFGTTKEILATLKPAFRKNGTVSAGNAAGINDGAAAVILMSGKKAQEKGLRPLASVESYGSSGVSPEIMGVGPIEATKRAMKAAGVGFADVDVIELNEAFAAQAVAVIRELGLDTERVNVNGGAIALGHPIGASGSRLLVTLLHELKRRKGTYGLATLCIGGGQGIAMVVRRTG